MPSYTPPSNVSVGTLLDNSLLDTLFGDNGTLNYLYDGIHTNGINCPPMYILASTSTTSKAHGVKTNVVFNTFTYGSQFWDGSKISMASCTTQSLTNRKFLVHFRTLWQTATPLGVRSNYIDIATTNCTTTYTPIVATRTAATTGNATVSQLVTIPFIDSATLASFTLTFSVRQNSGASITSTSYLRMYQIPNV